MRVTPKKILDISDISDIKAFFNYANYLSCQGKADLSIKLLNTLQVLPDWNKSTSIDKSHLFYCLGVAHYERCDPENARDNCANALSCCGDNFLKESPEYTENIMSLMRIYNLLGKVATLEEYEIEAKNYFNKAMDTISENLDKEDEMYYLSVAMTIESSLDYYYEFEDFDTCLDREKQLVETYKTLYEKFGEAYRPSLINAYLSFDGNDIHGYYINCQKAITLALNIPIELRWPKYNDYLYGCFNRAIEKIEDFESNDNSLEEIAGKYIDKLMLDKEKLQNYSKKGNEMDCFVNIETERPSALQEEIK